VFIQPSDCPQISSMELLIEFRLFLLFGETFAILGELHFKHSRYNITPNFV
jgi:hypothetical protein